MQNTKPTPEQFGWHNQNGFDDEPSGWMYEEGEERYFAALAAWDAENKNLTANDIAQIFIEGFEIAGRCDENTGATAENWLTQKIGAYAHAKYLEAWKEVNDAWAGGYLTFSYIAEHLDYTGEPCPGCTGPCGQCD